MGVHAIRVIFVLLNAAIGYMVGLQVELGVYGMAAAVLLAVLLSVGLIFVEQRLRKVPVKTLLGGIIGLSVALVAANLLTYSLVLGASDTISLNLRLFVHALFGYAGLVLGLKKGGDWSWSQYREWFKRGAGEANMKILDTSVIIDGRVADICEAGFLEGVLVVPQFVLRELQQIADSSDPLKRNRGRRGLDILQKIQKNVDLQVRIIDQDFPKIKEVDAKLVALGKVLTAKVLTNDYNLNKVAELQGVPVLNINQLANAVKPVVLPGENMHVYVLKEGKEYGQGVAYLDDGTMVVIDNGKRHIGAHIEVVVTSVLQTTAGRMIFTRLKEDLEREGGS